MIFAGALFILLKGILSQLDPYKETKEMAKRRLKVIWQRLGRSLNLNEYEQMLAANVMNPDSIDVTFDDISGMDHMIQDMELKVLTPMLHPELYSTTLWKQTKGVLLYGPPGTGKTMLAKALAKQSNCFLLNVTASAVMSKWLGDANRLIRAVFTLAEKLQPCIIFIDEVDAILGKRGSHSEHEATLQAKTEFMQLWDGMESGRGMRIAVMGATNRPWMLDDAVLRRFSLQYEMGLPNKQQRAAIIRGYLVKHHDEVKDFCQGVHPTLLALPWEAGPIDRLAEQTEGFSGSDLMELCSQAAQHVLNEYWLQQRGALSAQAGTSGGGEMRLLHEEDFQQALRVVRPATSNAWDYHMKTWGRGPHGVGEEDEGALPGGSGGPSPQMLQMLLRLFQQQLQQQRQEGGPGGGDSNGEANGSAS